MKCYSMHFSGWGKDIFWQNIALLHYSFYNWLNYWHILISKWNTAPTTITSATTLSVVQKDLENSIAKQWKLLVSILYRFNKSYEKNG